MPVFHLGGPRASQDESDVLRGGDVEFQSPRGLAVPSRILVEALPKKPVKRILTGLDTEGAVALAATAVHPGAEVRWFHFDAYVTRKVRGVMADNAVKTVQVEEGEDLPEGPFDLVLLPFPGRGEALLMRDVLEAAHDALKIGGRLVASTDVNGSALRKEIDSVFGQHIPGAAKLKRGAQFYALREKEKAQRRDRSHVVEAAIRTTAGARAALAIETRPGTFSHGTLDMGTRALLEWYVPGDAKTTLDLGAGCGWIGIHAAKADPETRVVMVESNARAVGCARRNVASNGVEGRVDVLLRADLENVAPPPAADGTPSKGFDLVLSNPPYFSDFRIANSFAIGARETLRRGGRIAFVVRHGAAARAHAEVLEAVFRNCTPYDAGEYAILTAKR